MNEPHFMDKISWMNFITSYDYMNFNRYTTPLGLLQIHIIHKNGHKENMKFNSETFQFAHNMLRKQFRAEF